MKTIVKTMVKIIVKTVVNTMASNRENRGEFHFLKISIGTAFTHFSSQFSLQVSFQVSDFTLK